MVTAADLRNSFDAWASIAARLRGRRPAERAKILADLGIEEVWAGADAQWRATLIEDLAAGSLKRAKRFGEICASDLAVRNGAAPPADLGSALPPAPGATSPSAEDMPRPLGPAYHAPLVDPLESEAPPDFRHRATFGSAEELVSPTDENHRFDFPPMSVEDPATQPAWEELNMTAPVGMAINTAVKALHWSMAKYAQYCADIARHEAGAVELEDVYARWGMTEDIHLYVREVWTMRLESNAQEKAHHDALVKYYGDMASERRSGGD